MRKHRFFVENDLRVNQSIDLNEEASHQILKVLRLNISDKIFLFNNSGYEYCAEITNITKKSVHVTIINAEQGTKESAFKIHLGQVVGKGDKLEIVIQKATELGVAEITPLYSERSVVKQVLEKNEQKLEHWQRIAMFAACQCWRNYVPKINTPSTLENWITQVNIQNKLILAPHIQAKKIKELNLKEHTAVLIGPEGGFSDQEFTAALNKQFIPVALGPRILRTETAAIAAIAILQSYYGDC